MHALHLNIQGEVHERLRCNAKPRASSTDTIQDDDGVGNNEGCKQFESLCCESGHQRAVLVEMVGPAGFEPATKGFTVVPMFPKGVDYLFTRAFRMFERAVGCGTL